MPIVKVYTNGKWEDVAGASGHTHEIGDIIDFPTSMPASDVFAWAKATTKPSYTASEVGADASGSASTALLSAKSYTDSEIAEWIGDKKVSEQISTAIAAKQDKISTETWIFTLEDGSTVTKAVYVG